MQNDKKLKKALTEYLNYLLTECPPEEYDSNEISICIELIEKLSMDEEYQPTTINLPHTKTKPNRIIVQPYTPSSGKKIAYLSIALAACIITITLLGFTAPVLADPNNGFFHWIKNDETGMQMVTSPSALLQGTPVPEECNCCPDCSCGCKE